jgi:hypothetical protein
MQCDHKLAIRPRRVDFCQHLTNQGRQQTKWLLATSAFIDTNPTDAPGSTPWLRTPASKVSLWCGSKHRPKHFNEGTYTVVPDCDSDLRDRFALCKHLIIGKMSDLANWNFVFHPLAINFRVVRKNNTQVSP